MTDFNNIETSFVQQYGRNVQMMAQQMGSKLRDKVMTETVTGERHYFELYNTNSAMQEVTVRHGDLNATDTVFERRAVDLVDYEDTKWLSSFDKAKMLADPLNPVVQAQAAQMGRQIDDIIIAAAYADMKTGKSGTTTSSATTAIAINSWAYGTGTGNSNLTISKIIELQAAFDANDVPLEGRYLVVDPINHSKLLATAEATSSDFVTNRNLESGRVEGLVGFDLIVSSRIGVDGSGYRRCFGFQKSGLALAVGVDAKTDISINRQKSGLPVQAYIALSMGATRLENSKVREIKCLAT